MAIPKYKDSNGNWVQIPMFANGTDGWFSLPAGVTVTYAVGATAPLFNITINTDITSKVGAGMELKLYQNNTVKKFVVMSITSTSAVLYGTAGNALTNTTIMNPYYSPTVPLGYPPADFILETGTTGIWTWEKWFSGKAECWTTSTQSGSWTCSSSLVGWYRDTSNWPTTLGLPFTFVKKPIVKVNLQSADGVYNVIERSTTTAALFFLVTLQTHAAETITYDISCSGGTWK